MKVLIAAACICVIAVTVGAAALGFNAYQNAQTGDLMDKCRKLAAVDQTTLTDFEQAEAKVLAEKCIAYIRS